MAVEPTPPLAPTTSTTPTIQRIASASWRLRWVLPSAGLLVVPWLLGWESPGLAFDAALHSPRVDAGKVGHFTWA